jgi:hypothetical protein
MEIDEETQGRGKMFTPDEYKKIRDEVKEDLKTDHSPNTTISKKQQAREQQTHANKKICEIGKRH